MAELLSITILTAIDAPTAVLSPDEEPQLPGSSQVASDANAIAQALVTNLLVACDVTLTLRLDVMLVPVPIMADWLS